MMRINSYGELLLEIDRVKKSIIRVKEEIGYEQGDEIDLELYLITLEQTKKYNDKLNELGLSSFCYRCQSTSIDVEKYWNIKDLTYEFQCTCNDCGGVRIVKVNREDLMELYDIKKGNRWWV